MIIKIYKYLSSTWVHSIICLALSLLSLRFSCLDKLSHTKKPWSILKWSFWSPKNVFSRGQSFRQRSPFPQGLNESLCLLKGETFLSLVRTCGPYINVWVVPIYLSRSMLASSIDDHKSQHNLHVPFLPFNLLYKMYSLFYK